MNSNDTKKDAAIELPVRYDDHTTAILDANGEDIGMVNRNIATQVVTIINSHEALAADLETERMRLAGCGVLAMSNTRESLERNRQMHPDYNCASVQDVIKAVEREIVLRESNEALTAELTSLRSPWVRIESEADLPKESGKSYYWTGKNGKVSQYAFFGLEKSLIRYILANEVAWMPVPDKPPPFDSNKDAAGVEETL